MPAWLALLATLPALAAPPGDAARGRALLLQRQETGCILCHALPGLPQGGDLGPPLGGPRERYTSEEQRTRIADARRANPDTMMLRRTWSTAAEASPPGRSPGTNSPLD